jgi:thymidylate synthase
MMAQFYVTDDLDETGEWIKKLSCLVYMRSNDLFLGAPFNIASYALLTHMLAQMTGMKAHRLHYHIGDAHVYKNHVDQVRQLLTRPIRPFPTLLFHHIPSDMTKWKFTDMELHDYFPHPTLSAPMAV